VFKAKQGLSNISLSSLVRDESVFFRMPFWSFSLRRVDRFVDHEVIVISGCCSFVAQDICSNFNFQGSCFLARLTVSSFGRLEDLATV
jgi:hypothetical protein